ncbi:sugar ABC transporter substrate-binding protein [Pacificimonas flava]|uniref:Periplasmic binding protein/LacI transcriptional regulator n=1 Tax=Pacificimonas flava TaxID=1234595 RepID=M2SGB4_9SPHN|nr:sugar ABC transporter substrate-binding protein [Pacificimonas flava]EMD84410.1 periplasmic binding protein/LacI transcriptional regulator [Pacificimonas flava]MBB5279718.1 ribose transport system substrate-binding protein [Pacificimonas flava]
MRRRPVPLALAALVVLVAAASLVGVRQAARNAYGSAAPATGEDGRYGLSTVGLSYPFAAAIAKGFSDAAARAGASTIILDAQGSVQKQANDIDDLLAQRVDGVAVMPLDSIVAQGWVKRAGAAGIPMAAVAALVGDPATRAVDDVYPGLVALASQDEVAAGRRAGELAASLLPAGGSARIAIVEGAAGFPEVEQRARGFRAALDEAGLEYRIVASQPGNWTSEGGEAACQNILAAQPGIDLFFNEADDMVIGCARAVRAAGSDAKLIGVGGSKLAVASIKAGAVDGTVCFKPEALGALAFDSLHGGGEAGGDRFRTYPIPAVTQANVDDCVGQW